MTGAACDPGAVATWVGEAPGTYGGPGYVCGSPADYDRDHGVDLAQLSAFLEVTQTSTAEALDLHGAGPTRQKFLARLQGEVTKRGTIDVLRRGVSHGPHHLDLFYATPTPGNAKA